MGNDGSSAASGVDGDKHVEKHKGHWSEKYTVKTILITLSILVGMSTLTNFIWGKVDEHFQIKSTHLDDKMTINSLREDIKSLSLTVEKHKEAEEKARLAFSEKDKEILALNNEVEILKIENRALTARASAIQNEQKTNNRSGIEQEIYTKLKNAEDKNVQLENELTKIKGSLANTSKDQDRSVADADAKDSRPYTFSMKDIRMGQAFIDPLTTASVTVNAFWNYNTANGILSLPDKEPVDIALKPGQTFAFSVNRKKYRMIISMLDGGARKYSVDVMESAH